MTFPNGFLRVLQGWLTQTCGMIFFTQRFPAGHNLCSNFSSWFCPNGFLRAPGLHNIALLALAGNVLVPTGWILVPAGTIFATPGLHFESFVSLWGEPEAPGARHCEKFEKVRKMKRLGSSIGSLLGHILRPLPPKIEPTSVLLRSFVSLFSRAFLAVFRSGFLEEIVESRRRPMCV